MELHICQRIPRAVGLAFTQSDEDICHYFNSICKNRLQVLLQVKILKIGPYQYGIIGAGANNDTRE